MSYTSYNTEAARGAMSEPRLATDFTQAQHLPPDSGWLGRRRVALRISLAVFSALPLE